MSCFVPLTLVCAKVRLGWARKMMTVSSQLNTFSNRAPNWKHPQDSMLSELYGRLIRVATFPTPTPHIKAIPSNEMAWLAARRLKALNVDLVCILLGFFHEVGICQGAMYSDGAVAPRQHFLLKAIVALADEVNTAPRQREWTHLFWAPPYDVV